MKKIKFDYKFITFLYAYLRQIDLSLDRSRWGSFDLLREYYKEQIQPKAVSEYIIKFSQLDSEKIHLINFMAEVTFVKKIEYLIARLLGTNSFLTNKEIYYCCQKLLILQEYLDSNEELHKLEVEKLRIEFVKFTYNILEYKIRPKDRYKTMRVEHFLQNEKLKCVSVNEFIKGFEL